ncbi:helix-turn-helix domain-containing protein [Solwaraspora sp. WMMD406]|uniref:helix-turn-helix domain-containing protein n=1 Tax=Solwaraspora sp. WMMD406 TaxID=3016095 RepID=UPI0024174041|nr:helix-turn-helix domain-containing protein [Solwaraspora sp. WMMD406]MDG4767049.1 helix-turn-helix domain-containing protein [Solwaraspora sp. WMMD406]
MPYVLDTTDLPQPDRVEAVYLAMMYASAPCHVIHEDPDGDIFCRMELWDLGNANIFISRSTGIRLLRTARQAKQDAMPVVALSVQRQAHGHLEQHKHLQVVPPGELLAVDLSAPYDYSWSGDGAAGCIQIPSDQLGLPIDVIRQAIHRLRASPLYGMVTNHIAHLVHDPARVTADPAAASVTTASVELARALLASAAHADRLTSQVLAETLLTRVRTYVRQHLADPDLTPGRIATAHNVSLRHLYKVCAQADISLEQWIISERLQHAWHDLRQPENRYRPVAAIAHRWGFRDTTHFTRRFKTRYGISPGQLRRSYGDTPPP